MSRKKSGAELMRRGSGEAIAFARMLRAGNFNSAIVYVEGDSDITFYKHLVDDKYVTLEQTKGKKAAMDAVASANKAKKKGILAFVDSDFDHILGIESDVNIIRTDTHDIETLMICYGAFDYSRNAYVDTHRLNEYDYDEESLWNKVIEIAKTVGKIRLLSAKYNWNMKFSSEGVAKRDNLEAEDVIKFQNGEISFDVHEYIYQCVNAAFDCKVDVSTVEATFNDDVKEYDTWQICRGHDISTIISILYSKKFYGKHNVSRYQVESTIASTYNASRNFKKSKMYEAIKKWQNDNLGWKILSNEMM